MPALVQICIVVATLAFVAVVVATIVTLLRLGEAVTRLTVAAQESMGQVKRLVLETQELLASAREVLAPAKQVARRFQALGERAAGLSQSVLDEIERPVVTAVAVSRGVRAGTSRLIELFTRRIASTNPFPNNGEHGHE